MHDREHKILITTELSRRCNIRCPHCITMAGPEYRHEMSMKYLRHIIDEIIAEEHYRHVINFSGGEPFLTFNRLKKAVSYANKVGVKVGLVTNGFWAESSKKAMMILNQLGDIFLMNISLDCYHQRFIPFRYVVNAAEACLKKGIKVKMRCIHFGISREDKRKAVLYYRKIIGPIDKKIKIVSIPFIRSGRAKQITDSLPIRLATKVPKNNRCGILRSIFISSYGDVYPCCDSLVNVKKAENVILGNLKSAPLSKIIKKSKSTFLPNFIKKYGIPQLLRIIGYIKGKDFARRYYTNIQENDRCEVCCRIFDDSSMISLFGRMSGKDSSKWEELTA